MLRNINLRQICFMLVIYHKTVFRTRNWASPTRTPSWVYIIWASALHRMRIAAVCNRDVICATTRKVFPWSPLGWTWYLVKFCKAKQIVFSLCFYLRQELFKPLLNSPRVARYRWYPFIMCTFYSWHTAGMPEIWIDQSGLTAARIASAVAVCKADLLLMLTGL